MEKISVSGFDWDAGNWPKCGKHGVTKQEIEEIFFSAPAVMPDPYPEEKRLRAIGKTATGRYIFLVFMYRIVDEETLIRPISARFMHQKEISYYENQRS